jgi:hypothetical protein
MKRPVILGTPSQIQNYYRKDATALFAEIGSNTGNQAINFGLACQLPYTTRFMPWDTAVSAIREAGDVLVIPMANFLGKHTDLASLAERIDRIDLPVIGVGLGAQSANHSEDISLSEGTLKWLQTIVRYAPGDQPNLGVRGSYTLGQLARLGFPSAALVTGCPSNFINPSKGLAKKVAQGFSRRPRQIAVTAGIQFSPELTKIERELADIVTLTGGAYIVQHGIDMIQIARNAFMEMQPERLKSCHEYIMPNRSLDEFIAWCRHFAFAFFDTLAWMDFLRRFDFVVGTRFHGAMLAIQAGIPAGCIAHDSRTLEMCQTMAIPVRHYKDISGPLTQHNVMDYFSFDAEAYDANRHALHKNFLALYRSADLPVREVFRRLE